VAARAIGGQQGLVRPVLSPLTQGASVLAVMHRMAGRAMSADGRPDHPGYRNKGKQKKEQKKIAGLGTSRKREVPTGSYQFRFHFGGPVHRGTIRRSVNGSVFQSDRCLHLQRKDVPTSQTADPCRSRPARGVCLSRESQTFWHRRDRMR